MPQTPSASVSRRRFLGTTALAGTGAVFGAVEPIAAATHARQDVAEEEAIATAGAPDWSFSVYLVQDPYAGQIQQPATPTPGTRYVAAEVSVVNASNQPLYFTPAEIRLRDATGTEYRGGSAVGTEPYLTIRNLNGGEMLRGWVWFIVPEAAHVVAIAYYAPQPVFSVAIA